jgi:hypothetical protein
MKQLNLYIKPTGFYWTRTRVVYGLILLIFLIYFILNLFYKNEEINKYLFYTGIGIFLLATIIKMITMVTYQVVYGKLIVNGITLDYDKVVVQDKVFNVDEIETISFVLSDYYGLFVRDRTNFEPSLSNGLNNTMDIILKNGQKFTYNFQRELPYEFYTSKKLFAHYYKIGIVKVKEKRELYKLLSIDTTEQKQNFDKLIA